MVNLSIIAINGLELHEQAEESFYIFTLDTKNQINLQQKDVRILEKERFGDEVFNNQL